ncbi:MAG: glycosyltransferase family 9 protein [Gammaproteobacteria bacterium]|nr:MAG: glycosyltransferase family 9 protein [Gammaproteobacteria bacterium]
MHVTFEKILVIRNDRLGDFMLAFPTLVLLKRALPDTELHVLVPEYTAEMASACDAVDGVVIDPGPDAGVRKQLELIRRLKDNSYDASITLFSTARIGWCLLLAAIPYRLGPATKAAQVLYNHRLVQRRSRSAKPEYEYNLDLGLHLLADVGIPAPALPTPPYLHFPDEHVARLRSEFCRRHRITAEQRLVFIHPGSGGSANNLTLRQYSELVRRLRSYGQPTIVISAGPGEEAVARELGALLGATPHVIYVSDQGLRRFAEHIQFADVFISGSTGPLHVAGALNRRTAAFYPRRRSATELRWQTLSAPEHRLAFSVPAGVEEGDMHSIDLVAAAAAIGERFLRP